MKMELEKNKISAENVRNTLEKMHDYHKNSEKVEFTITEEKEPFPEFEDIEVASEGYLIITIPEFIKEILLEIDQYNDMETIPIESQYRISKLAHENGIPVTWKLKEKIDLRLHKNRALALAIGRWMVEGNTHTGIPVNQKYYLQGIMVFNSRIHCILNNGYAKYSTETEVSINYDYVIPEKVIQWMKEYQEQGII